MNKCIICGTNTNLTRHHMFSNTKLNRKLYKSLLDDSSNIVYICIDDHLNKPIPKLSEIDFCKLMGISPRSKTGKLIWERMQHDNLEAK